MPRCGTEVPPSPAVAITAVAGCGAPVSSSLCMNVAPLSQARPHGLEPVLKVPDESSGSFRRCLRQVRFWSFEVRG